MILQTSLTSGLKEAAGISGPVCVQSAVVSLWSWSLWAASLHTRERVEANENNILIFLKWFGLAEP